MARRRSLKDLTLATVTTNTTSQYAAGTPQKVARAINAKVSVKKSSESLYSDDNVEEVVGSLDSIEVEFETNDLPPAVHSIIYGSSYENGFLVEGKDDVPQEIALGWRAKRTADGKYEFVWLYCGKASEGVEDEYETAAGKVATKTPKTKLTFYPREKDGKFRNRIFEDVLLENETDAKTAIQNWFRIVQEPGGSVPQQ